MPSQQGRELGERRPGRRRLSGPELVEGLGRRDAWGKLDGDEQSDLGVPRERDAEPGIDAVLANQRYTAGVDVLDGRRIQCPRVAGPSCVQRHVADLSHE